MIEALGGSLILAAILGGWTLVRRVARRRLEAGNPVDVIAEKIVQLPWFVALAGELPELPASMQAKEDLPDRDVYEWLLDQGGVEHGETKLRIVVTSRSERTVVITNLVVIVEREQALAGSYVACPAGGGQGATVLLFNLDDKHPVARERQDDGFQWTLSTSPYFDGHYLSLDKGEAHTIIVACTSQHNLCHWTLALDVVIGERRTTIPLDYDGRSFSTNGGSSDSFSHLYHWAWYDGGGFKPVA